MARDPVVDEVRRVRMQIDSECEEDSEKYFAYFQRLQRQYGERLVRRSPRRRPKPGETGQPLALSSS